MKAFLAALRDSGKDINVPTKTTVLGVCSGKSNIEGCTAKTIMQLSNAPGCTMEELMQIENALYDRTTGLPRDESYLEKGLPAYLQKSIAAMQASWSIIDGGEKDLHWDIFWCDLNADITARKRSRRFPAIRHGFFAGSTCAWKRMITISAAILGYVHCGRPDLQLRPAQWKLGLSV